MRKASVRKLPAQIPPVETGPLRFGDDAAGVFIRADNALAFSIALRSLLHDEELKSTCLAVWKTEMENLLRLLESSRKEHSRRSDALGFTG
ncbi:MAG TPA: hypothetical protein VLT16_14770 [Candidatus Limnocylindrales bacterium]|nr:hypothetical protein [Candidatus Limnocylindrales bacterium]